MKDFLRTLGFYLRERLTVLLLMAATAGIFLFVFWLAGIPLGTVGYALCLSAALMLVVAVFDFRAYWHKHRQLETYRSHPADAPGHLPEKPTLLESDYRELLAELTQINAELADKNEQTRSEMFDYYTLWAHQIKTPIAGMRLMLQSQNESMPSGLNSELNIELFRIEQYVEMALGFIRSGSMSSDLMLKRYSLDDIVRQAVRKYARMFIRSGTRLELSELNAQALTDEKWLCFVIEQLLSNAVKYTGSGTVSIYMDPDRDATLVIRDTGIGIQPEDLPRLGERGFTGYNGRADKKSTGIGLYLCKRVLARLSHTLEIESEVGKGTTVRIGLGSAELRPE